MKLNRRQTLALAGAGAFLAACGGGSETKQEGDSGSAGPAQAATTAPTPDLSKAKRGGQASFAYTNVPQNLDLHKIVSPTLGMAATLSFNRLIRHKSDSSVSPETYTVTDDLASSWEQPDATTYVFKLRPGVKWQNRPPYNGRPLVARDVIRSYERQQTKNASFIWAYLLAFVDTMTAVDDQTVRITAKEPFAGALDSLALYQSPILPMDSVDSFGSLEKLESWVGTGPFNLTEWKPGVGFSFERNPDYFEQGYPYLDRVELKEMLDDSARLAAFLAGEIDQAEGFQPELQDTVRKGQPKAQLLKFSAIGGTSYAWTQKKGPFKDARVRKAWDLLVDREKMIASLTGGEADMRVSPLSSGFPEFTRSQADIKKDARFDLAEAKKLLEASGNGSGFKAGLLGNSVDEKSAIEWAIQQGKLAGITIDPQVVERTVYLTAQQQHNFDLGQVYAIRAYHDPDEYLYPLFFTGASKNYFEFSDPALDDLILKQRRELNREARKKILQEIDARWTTDFNYHTFYFTKTSYDAISPRIQNYTRRNPTEFTQLRYAWKE
jgi:peptide/nickel transport system substrate-binding protein